MTQVQIFSNILKIKRKSGGPPTGRRPLTADTQTDHQKASDISQGLSLRKQTQMNAGTNRIIA